MEEEEEEKEGCARIGMISGGREEEGRRAEGSFRTTGGKLLSAGRPSIDAETKQTMGANVSLVLARPMLGPLSKLSNLHGSAVCQQ